MTFVYKVVKLFICFAVCAKFCTAHPLENVEFEDEKEGKGDGDGDGDGDGYGVYSAESSEPALAHQTELSGDLALYSQAESSSSDSGLKISLFKPAERTRESVNLETEGVPSTFLSLYDKSQKKYLDKTQHVPLLDTISEHEKYGNNGDMFDGISRGLVNGFEAFSNLLNTLITKPKEIARSISKGLTTQLDVLGGKLVGLQ